MEKEASCDPYCVVTLGKESRKTHTIKKSASPKWDDTFTLLVLVFCLVMDSHTLVIGIYMTGSLCWKSPSLITTASVEVSRFFWFELLVLQDVNST